MLKVLLDTEVIVAAKFNFTTAQLLALKQHVADGNAVLLTTAMIEGEIDKRMSEL